MAFPSTFLDLQNMVIANLRLDPTADRQKVKDQINRYQARLVETEAIQTAAVVTLSPNVGSYFLPTQIQRINAICAAPAGSPGGYGAPLEEVGLDQILAWRQSGTVGPVANATCTSYALVGQSQLELFPTPAAADVLLFYYVTGPLFLVADTDLPAIQEPYATDLLTYGPSFEMALFKSDPGAADWHTLYEDARHRYTQNLNRRRNGGDTKQLQIAGMTPVSVRRDIDTG